MRNTIIPARILLALLLLLPPFAGGACPLGYTPMTTVTTYPDGPNGSIFVETSPSGAIVFVNGVNHGHSPATITGLYKGSYTITVTMPGFQEYSTTTTISGPTRSSVYCPLVPDNTGKGMYVISTPPGAKVYLDGFVNGTTPVLLADAAPGLHHLVVNLSGYDDWESTIVVPAAGTKTVAVVLEKAESSVVRGINLTSKPSGAKVLLDSSDRGVTPLVLENVAEGVHILELEHPGYMPWKSTINVPETGMRIVSVNLTPEPAHAPGWITVSSVPGDASVTLDGNFVGKTPVNSTLNLEEIPPGEHTIVVVLDGYRAQVIRTTVSPNLVSALNATLVPESAIPLNGSLSVVSEPAGAMVFLDNLPRGLSPLIAGDLAAGNHQVSLRHEGYEDYSVSILVGAGVTRNVTASLVPVTTPSVYSPLLPATVICSFFIVLIVILQQRR